MIYEFGDRRRNDILTGENRRTRRKTCPSATLSTTNPTWIDLGANPGLRGERPVTNDLSHGTPRVGDTNVSEEHAASIFRVDDVSPTYQYLHVIPHRVTTQINIDNYFNKYYKLKCDWNYHSFIFLSVPSWNIGPLSVFLLSYVQYNIR
jgi:hypothetical protein